MQWEMLTVGLVQGSKLFTIYMNDLDEENLHNTVRFADVANAG